MKRRAFKLLLFLLAGALINVAVAWGREAYEQHIFWQNFDPLDCGGISQSDDLKRFFELPDSFEQGDVKCIRVSDFIALPLQPAWPGFAINTIFYAAIVWMLFAVPGAVRRRVRIKRGQCASCGYSLRESVSEKCPECGGEICLDG